MFRHSSYRGVIGLCIVCFFLLFGVVDSASQSVAMVGGLVVVGLLVVATVFALKKALPPNFSSGGLPNIPRQRGGELSHTGYPVMRHDYSRVRIAHPFADTLYGGASPATGPPPEPPGLGAAAALPAEQPLPPAPSFISASPSGGPDPARLAPTSVPAFETGLSLPAVEPLAPLTLPSFELGVLPSAVPLPQPSVDPPAPFGHEPGTGIGGGLTFGS